MMQLADLMTRRLEWAKGSLPRSYTQALVTIYAHAVIYALDGIEKSLCQLARVPCLSDTARDGIAAAHQAFTAALPDVRLVRDSAHQLEDRARGMARNGRELDYQPIAHDAINAPAGHHVLMMSALSGTQSAIPLATAITAKSRSAPHRSSPRRQPSSRPSTRCRGKSGPAPPQDDPAVPTAGDVTAAVSRS